VSNNVELRAETVERLAKHPNIVGCKLSHGNLDDHALVSLSPKIDHDNFHVYTGLGQQLIGVLGVGGAGAIDGLAACFPRSMVHLYDMIVARDAGEATNRGSELLADIRELQYKVCAAEKLVVRWGTIGIREALSRIRDFGDVDGGRWPLKGGFPDHDTEWIAWISAIRPLHEVELQLEEEAKEQINEQAKEEAK
jgi:2-keto-3-deoxy-L-rhamnonate aldolase